MARREQIDEKAFIEMRATYKTKSGKKLCAMALVHPAMLKNPQGVALVMNDLRAGADDVVKTKPPRRAKKL